MSVSAPSNRPQFPELSPLDGRLIQSLGGVLALAALAVSVDLALQHALLGLSALLIGVVAVRHPRWFYRQVIRPMSPLLLAGLAVLLAMLVSLWASPIQWADARFWPRGRAWVGFFPLVIGLRLLGQGPHAEPWRRRILWALLAGAALAAIVGVVQAAFHVHLGQALGQVLGAAPHKWQVRVPQHPDQLAAIGFFINRTRFAHVLIVPIGLTWGLLLWSPRPRLRCLALGLMALFLTALVLAYTRAALLAVLLVLPWGLRQRFRTRGGQGSLSLRAKMLISLVFISFVAIALAQPQVRSRLASSTSRSANSDRMFLWERAGAMIHDFGATGLGFANYRWGIQAYHDRTGPHFRMRSQGHNLLASLWVEMGPLGLLAFMLFVVVIVRSRRPVFADPPSSSQDSGQGWGQIFRHGLGLAGLAALIISFAHDPLYVAVEAAAWVWIPALIGANFSFAGFSAVDEQRARTVTRSFDRLRLSPAVQKFWVFAWLAIGLASLPWISHWRLTVLLLLLLGLALWLSLWSKTRRWLQVEIGLLVLLGILAFPGMAGLIWSAPLALRVLLSGLGIALGLLFVLQRDLLRAFMAWSIPLWFAGFFALLQLSPKGRLAFDTWASISASWTLGLLFVLPLLTSSPLDTLRLAVSGLGKKRWASLLLIVLATVLLSCLGAWFWQGDGQRYFYESQTAHANKLLKLQRQGQGATFDALVHREICHDLGQDEEKSALLLLRWAALLRPGTWMAAPAKLWRAELVQSFDPPQARDILRRCLVQYSDRELLAGATWRSADLRTSLKNQAQQRGRLELLQALQQEARDSVAPTGGEKENWTCPELILTSD